MLVIDFSMCKIVGYYLSLDMRVENVVKVLKMVVKDKWYVGNSVYYLDRGL